MKHEKVLVNTLDHIVSDFSYCCIEKYEVVNLNQHNDTLESKSNTNLDKFDEFRKLHIFHRYIEIVSKCYQLKSRVG